MIKLKNISKKYQHERNVLENITLSFEEIGMTMIVGKSGAGKSTLLNILAGFDQSSTGEMIIDGKTVASFKEQDYDRYRNQYIGFVFQEFHLIEDYDVYENIVLATQLQGKKPTEKEIDSLLEKLQILSYKHQKVSKLSGGEKQRVAIARALIKHPKVILADEPTGNLDQKTGQEVMQLLKKISHDTLVIMVTHNQDYAKTYGDRVIELEDGKVIRDSKEIPFKEEECTYQATKTKLPWHHAFHLGSKAFFRHKLRHFSIAFFLAFVATFMGIAYPFFHYNLNRHCQDVMEESRQMDYTVRKISNIQNMSTFLPFNNEDIENLQKIPGELIYHFTNREDALATIELIETAFTTTELYQGRLPANKKEILISSSLAQDLEEDQEVLNQPLSLGKDELIIVGIVENEKEQIYGMIGFVKNLKSYEITGISKQNQYIARIQGIPRLLKNNEFIQKEVPYFDGTTWKKTNHLEKNEVLLRLKDVIGDLPDNEKEYIENHAKEYLGKSVTFDIYENLDIYVSGMQESPAKTYQNIKIIGIVTSDTPTLFMKDLFAGYNQFSLETNAYQIHVKNSKKVLSNLDFPFVIEELEDVYTYSDHLKKVQPMITLFYSFTILFTSGLLVYFIYYLLKTKHHEWAILKALGATKQDLLKTTMIELLIMILNIFWMSIVGIWIGYAYINKGYQVFSRTNLSILYFHSDYVWYLLLYFLVMISIVVYITITKLRHFHISELIKKQTN